MQSFDIIKQSKPSKSFRVAAIMGAYDLPDNAISEHFVGVINPPDDWQIGLIVGASGTGKTTIAKELFPDAYIERFEYTHESILDDMPKNCSVQEIAKAFSNVGLASVPSWLKSYSVLSNGEKMRCDLARAILSDKNLFVFDEFTSVVDRNVAKIGSFAMQKAIRKTKKQFIAVTCHYDVEDWLLPDWIFDTNSMTFRLGEGLKKNRPKCKFEIFETKQKEYYWRMFRKHHYLNKELNKAARVFVATLNDDLCGFIAILPFPHPYKKHTWKVTRAVVLPDFQGIGIAMRLHDFLGEMLSKTNICLITTTSNPAMIRSLSNSSKWICTRIGRVSNGSGSGKIQNKFIKGSTSSARITASFEYINK